MDFVIITKGPQKGHFARVTATTTEDLGGLKYEIESVESPGQKLWHYENRYFPASFLAPALRVFWNDQTGNFSFFENWKKATPCYFGSPEEWHNFYHTVNGSFSGNPRGVRIKRARGFSWGDEFGGKNYTLRKAKNDFQKHAN